MVIMCCTALCSNGLVHEGLFAGTTDAEAGEALYAELKACHFSRLPDTSATPQVIAQVCMHSESVACVQLRCTICRHTKDLTVLCVSC